MYHIYAREFRNGIRVRWVFDTRYQCEKHLRQIRRNGGMTHFYFISKLPYDKAVARYVDKEI